jgi:hypothetical protein
MTGALLFMILRFMLMLINVVGLCALPESEIELVDTGYSYRFEMALGYQSKDWKSAGSPFFDSGRHL